MKLTRAKRMVLNPAFYHRVVLPAGPGVSGNLKRCYGTSTEEGVGGNKWSRLVGREGGVMTNN